MFDTNYFTTSSDKRFCLYSCYDWSLWSLTSLALPKNVDEQAANFHSWAMLDYSVTSGTGLTPYAGMLIPD